MPQFDNGSFLNQIFWFFFFFINSYFLITYYFLPIICENLKFRKKKIKVNDKKFNKILFEKYHQQIFLNKIFKHFSITSNVLLKTINENSLFIVKPLKKKIFKNLIIKQDLTNFYIKLFSFSKKFN